MPEEVALLLQRDAAILIDESKAYGGLAEEGVMTEEQWQQWQQEKEDSIRHQKLEAFKQNRDKVRRFEEALAKSAKAKRRGAGVGSSAPDQLDQQAELQQTEHHQSDADPAVKLQAVEQKRQQRQRERIQRAKEADEEGPFAGEDPSDGMGDQGRGDGKEEDDRHEADQEPSEAALAQYNYTHTTQDSSQGLPWYDAGSASTLASSSSTLAQQFLPCRGTNRPLLDTTKHQIFTDLNTTHHYYLSCGLRFGGDFVAYPGDPFRYHSHYTVSVLADERSGWSAAKLVADGRLGTGVKKVHVVATVVGGRRATHEHDVEEQSVEKVQEAQAESKRGEQDEGTPRYYSLTWAGFGT